MKNNYFTGEFNEVGENTIDLDCVVKYWSHLWFISKYHDEYTLIKAWSKVSKEALRLKTKISEKQARELIKRLKLSEIKSPIFRHGSTFK